MAKQNKINIDTSNKICYYMRELSGRNLIQSSYIKMNKIITTTKGENMELAKNETNPTYKGG